MENQWTSEKPSMRSLRPDHMRTMARAFAYSKRRMPADMEELTDWLLESGKRKETIEEYLPLFEHMLTLVPAIYNPLVAKMVRDLDRLVHGYAVIIEAQEKTAGVNQ